MILDEAGGSATFTVAAKGSGTLSYQWRRGATLLINEPNHIAGVNEPTLTIVNVGVGDEGNYNCVISDSCGPVVSDPAALTIGECPADYNQDGLLISQDFFDFLAAFFAGLTTADFNHDTFINSQDLFDFLAAFFEGC